MAQESGGPVGLWPRNGRVEDWSWQRPGHRKSWVYHNTGVAQNCSLPRTHMVKGYSCRRLVVAEKWPQQNTGVAQKCLQLKANSRQDAAQDWS